MHDNVTQSVSKYEAFPCHIFTDEKKNTQGIAVHFMPLVVWYIFRHAIFGHGLKWPKVASGINLPTPIWTLTLTDMSTWYPYHCIPVRPCWAMNKRRKTDLLERMCNCACARADILYLWPAQKAYLCNAHSSWTTPPAYQSSAQCAQSFPRYGIGVRTCALADIPLPWLVQNA